MNRRAQMALEEAEAWGGLGYNGTSDYVPEVGEVSLPPTYTPSPVVMVGPPLPPSFRWPMAPVVGRARATVQVAPARRSVTAKTLPSSSSLDRLAQNVRDAKQRLSAVVSREGLSPADQETIRSTTEYQDLMLAQGELDAVQALQKLQRVSSGIFAPSAPVRGQADVTVDADRQSQRAEVLEQLRQQQQPLISDVKQQLVDAAQAVDSALDFGGTFGIGTVSRESRPWAEMPIPVHPEIAREEQSVQDVSEPQAKLAAALKSLSVVSQVEVSLPFESGPQLEVEREGFKETKKLFDVPLSYSEQYLQRAGLSEQEQAASEWEHQEAVQQAAQRAQQHFEALSSVMKDYVTTEKTVDALTAMGMNRAFEQVKAGGGSDDTAAKAALEYNKTRSEETVTAKATRDVVAEKFKAALSWMGQKGREVATGYERARSSAAKGFDQIFTPAVLTARIDTPERALHWVNSEVYPILWKLKFGKKPPIDNTEEGIIKHAIEVQVSKEFEVRLKDQFDGSTILKVDDQQGRDERFLSAQDLMETLRQMRARTIQLAEEAVNAKVARKIVGLQGYVPAWQSRMAGVLDFSIR